MRLNKLKLGDKKVFDQYLALEEHALSVYSFANIYVWKKFFAIRWALIEKSLCVFFQDKIGSFLYLAPLGKEKKEQVVYEALEILDELNKNPQFAHIENIEEKDLSFYQGLGLECRLKSHDYLCLRNALAQLKGNQFKSKRSSYNYFIKHYDFAYQQLGLQDRADCLKLYGLWQQQRQASNPERIYQGLLGDSRVALIEALDNYSALGFQGRVVRINQKTKGFTFGFALNAQIFCVFYEITDLSIKGLSQFIFRSFAQELKNYQFINLMDDSGLDNLKKVKLSYRPVKLVPAYIVRRVS